MELNPKLLGVLERAFAELNEELGTDPLPFAPATRLVGNEALDSLLLVLLITSIENGVEAELGVELALSNDESLLDPDGPMQDVGSLVDFLRTRTEP